MAEDDLARAVARERVYPPDNRQEKLAHLLKEGNGQTVGSLPDFIEGLLLVGKFDSIKVHQVVAINRAGQPVPMTDPTEAVLIGQSDPHQTMEFMLDKLATIYVSDSPGMSKMPPERRQKGRKEELLYLWNRFRLTELNQFEAARTEALTELSDKAKENALNDGGRTAREQISYGEGEYYERYKKQREEVDKEYLEQLKSELSNLKRNFDQIPPNYPWEA